MSSVRMPAELRRKARRLHRQRNGADAVVSALRRGASLQQSYERGGSRWWLSTGELVTDDVARIVVRDHRIVSAGDALFRGVPAQTYRFVEE
jgi:hypothetical protein